MSETEHNISATHSELLIEAKWTDLISHADSLVTRFGHRDILADEGSDVYEFCWDSPTSGEALTLTAEYNPEGNEYVLEISPNVFNQRDRYFIFSEAIPSFRFETFSTAG